jgi:hypothetical protein
VDLINVFAHRVDMGVKKDDYGIANAITGFCY